MWLVLGQTRLFRCVQSRVWRKEIEAQCNVRYKGRILGGLGGRRVGWRMGLEEQTLSGTNSELEDKGVEVGKTEAGK